MAVYDMTEEVMRLQATGARRIMTTEEVIALGGIPARIHCGLCSETWTDEKHVHRCPKLSPSNARERRRMERQRRDYELAQRAIFMGAIPPCDFCGAELRAGVQHDCPGTPAPLPHEVAALEWQRQGQLNALKGILEAE